MKRALAGLVILGLLVQVSLFAKPVSLVAAPETGSLVLALSVICTAHGQKSLPSQDVPGDRDSACLLCPACWNGAGAPPAILPTGLVHAIQHDAALAHAYADHRSVPPASFLHPPSRGPPAFI